MFFLLLAASRLAVIPPALAKLRGGAVLQELQIRRGAVLHALPELDSAIDVLQEGEASGLVLTIIGGEDGSSDTVQLAGLAKGQREELLRRESECRLRILDAPVPVIVIADGLLTGAAAALFLAGSHRVCTQRTVMALRECQSGLCPGFGLLDALAALPQPHVAMAAAMGALELTAHDMLRMLLTMLLQHMQHLSPHQLVLVSGSMRWQHEVAA